MVEYFSNREDLKALVDACLESGMGVKETTDQVRWETAWGLRDCLYLAISRAKEVQDKLSEKQLLSFQGLAKTAGIKWE